jgi:hypothetical protein
VKLVVKISNYKHQISNKSQISKSNDQNIRMADSGQVSFEIVFWVIGYYLEFGICFLPVYPN